ncbi:MAG: DUF5131 family protein, partial [bacterium]
MNKTAIQYVTHSWNPITGCSNTFACREYCWARKMAARMAANPKVKHRERYIDFKPAFWPERLDQPLRMQRPQRIAVNFMGDWACKGVPYEWQEKVLEATLDTPHTYLFLSKRPDIQASVVKRFLSPCLLPSMVGQCLFGTSISTQAEADERIPQLRQCPGRLWLSIEPMEGPIDLLKNSDWLQCGRLVSGGMERSGWRHEIEWVVVGGGPKPMKPDWVRSIRDQCQAAEVPFYLKQLTENGRRIPFDSVPLDLQIREFPDA